MSTKKYKAPYIQKIYSLRISPECRVGYEIFLMRMGIFKSKGNFSFAQIPKEYSLHYIRSGVGYFETKHGSFKAEKGDIFLFFPDIFVNYYDIADAPWQYIWFSLQGDNANNIFNLLGFSPEKPLVHGCETAIFQNFVSKFSYMVDNGLSGFFIPSLYAWELIGILNNMIKHDTTSIPKDKKIFLSAKEMIENSYGNIPLIKELAERLNISRATLFRIFKKECGLSPGECIIKHKIKRTVDVIKNTKLSFREISEIMGFGDISNFYTFVKKHTKMTPTEIRKNEK